MDRKWRLRGILGVVAALAVAGLLGFIVLPVVQGSAAGIDAFTAICRAVGILPGSPARPTPPSEAAPEPVTKWRGPPRPLRHFMAPAAPAARGQPRSAAS